MFVEGEKGIIVIDLLVMLFVVKVVFDFYFQYCL